jgi:Zn-dependent protease
MDVNFVFFIIVLIMSVVIHEVSHGYAADLLGDPTPRLDGRLTLNPLPHLDLLGSLIIPTIMYFSTGFMFGWAKPVVYNPYNLRNQRWGTVIVGAAGVLANFALAVIFGLLARFAPAIGLSPSFVSISLTIVLINLVLGVFNLIPVPPLDGSKVLFPLLPYRFRSVENFFTRNWYILVLLVLIFGAMVVDPW